MRKRRTHQPDFKARIALEALKGIKTTSQIAKEHEVHPVQVGEWKKHLQDHLADLFGKKADSSAEAVLVELGAAKAKIGELSLDLDYLKKKSAQLGLVIEPDSLSSRTLS
jgi:transposase